jgi:crotonobetainyl-CoA:carnitine CoA-transferase CaiB-like acyl-CoA transferase
MRQGLSDIRVVDFSTGISGAYATKLFADAGADVVKVEPPDGDPLRRWSASGADLGGADGPLFRFLNSSKRSIVGSADDPDVRALAEGADLVVESNGPGPGAFDVAGWRARDPQLVVVSISPRGLTGPWVDRPSTEFTLQAECGSIGGRGPLGKPPVQAGGKIAEWAAGVYAGPPALAAIRHARATGQGAHIDVSQLEAMLIATNLFGDLNQSLNGRPPLSGPSRWIELPSIEPTRDGWVGFNTNAMQMFHDFLVLIERPDWLEDPEMSTFPGRMKRLAEWNAAVHAWTEKRTTDEVVEAASLMRIPVAQVNSGKSVLEHEQFVARGVFVDGADGGFRQPRPPYLIEGSPHDAPRPAPKLGEHTGRIEARDRPAPVAPATAPQPVLPFKGLKILDLTCWWAGPAVTQLFAMLGAEVLHVEAVQRPDGMRLAAAGTFLDRDRWWEYSFFFLSINENKRDLTIDLNRPEGIKLVEQLVRESDIVAENYTPRVVENFGLGWDRVQRLNPQAVMLRMPAFGLTGPWRDRVGFAQTMEQISGLAYITGYQDGPPIIPRGPCDPLGGMHGAFALMVALAERDARGEGVLVEAPLVESALQLSAEQVVEYTATGTLLERSGNHSPGVAPQGVYACAGAEQWLALSIATDEQWAALVDALDRPGWATDPALATAAGRVAAQERLDAELAAWAAPRDLASTVEALLGRGVPAAAVADPRSISTNPQVAARGLYEQSTHPVVGTHPISTMPFKWSGIDRWIHTPAPTLGQHNAEVLRELGLSDDEIAKAEADALIGDRLPGN